MAQRVVSAAKSSHKRWTLTIQHARLTVARSDVQEPATFEHLMAGQEVVVSAIGARTRAPTTVYSDGVANIIQMMQANGVRRLLCISARGLDPGPLLHRWFAKHILWRLLRESYTDLVRMEAVVKAS